jgi:hypothetical protein
MEATVERSVGSSERMAKSIRTRRQLRVKVLVTFLISIIHGTARTNTDHGGLRPDLSALDPRLHLDILHLARAGLRGDDVGDELLERAGQRSGRRAEDVAWYR